MTNVTGWNELVQGNIMLSVLTMFNTVTAGWFVAVLFFIFQIALFIKTRNVTLSWVTGVLFTSVYMVSSFRNATSLHIIYVLLVFEFAVLLYLWFIK